MALLRGGRRQPALFARPKTARPPLLLHLQTTASSAQRTAVLAARDAPAPTPAPPRWTLAPGLSVPRAQPGGAENAVTGVMVSQIPA